MHNDLWLMESRHVEAWEAQVASFQDRIPEFKAIDGDSADSFTRVDVNESTATVFLHGPMISSVPSIMKFFGVEAVDMAEAGKVLLALDADESIDLIELNINSPGGTVNGTETLANIIANLSTPTVSVVSGIMASAALWVGAAAGTIESTTNTAMIGSIGVISVIVDSSRMAESQGVKVIPIRSSDLKGGPIDGAPVSDALIDDMKRIISQTFDLFKAAIGKFRNLSAEQVEAAATGQVFLAEEAQELGLIDLITAGNVSAQAKEEFAMDANTAIALAAEFPDLAAELKAHVANGSDESEIRADLGLKSLEAEVKTLKADANDAKAELAKVQEKADSVEAKDAEIKELQAKVDAFGTFEEQNEDPGVGAQASANAEDEPIADPTANMTSSEKADHYAALDAKAQEA